MINLISGKKTDYVIALPENPAPVELTAAEELKEYIGKAFGVTPDVKTESADIKKAFYIGRTNYAQSAGILGKSTENWIIKMHNGNLILTGGKEKGDRGVIYAIYHFLEDVVGVRWWTRFEEDVPSLSSLSLDDDFSHEGTPYFHYRKTLSHMAIPDFFYEARVRNNIVMRDDHLPGDLHHESVVRLGGAMQMGRPDHVHTLNHYFPADKYFDTHPDWFAWSEAENRRIPHGHYCLTNEEYIKAMTDKLIGFIEEDKEICARDGIEMPDFYSVSFPDSPNGFCMCEKCKKSREKSGFSGYAIDFINKIARKVGEKHPDVKVETLVYSLYLDKPLDDTLPEKNVIIRLAQVYVDIMHGIHNKGNAWYLNLLKDWSDICKRAGCELYIWEYMYNLFFDIPAPVANRLSDTFRAFRDYGVKGVFIENEHPSFDMWEMNQYLLTHLSEDPDADADALIDDFINRFYGPASPYIKEYYKELVRASEENNYSVFCVIESAHFNYLDVATVTKGMALLEKAVKAVEDDEVLLPRVSHMQAVLLASVVVKFYDLKRRAIELGLPFDYDRKALCDKVIAGFEESGKRPKIREGHMKMEETIKYFKTIQIESDLAPLPVELSGVNPSDVYQFFYKNTCRYTIPSLSRLYGFSVADDADSSTGRVMKLGYDDASCLQEIVALDVTSREKEGRKGIAISIQQDAKTIFGMELYKEDIVPDKYHLYHLGTVSGIRNSADTRVNIFGTNVEWLSLTGISVLFPMDACDVYVSMKFTGERYGGSKDNPDAVYLDRAFIVRH